MDAEQVRETLARCLEFEQIRRSGHLSGFLTFVVDRALAGAESEINEASIAIRALGRDDDFDPRIDPVVRVVAGRLRRALEMYALTAGRGDAVRIVLPKGSYVPRFDLADEAVSGADVRTRTGATGSAPTTIILVDDHVMLRRGLRALLDSEPDMRIVGEAGDGASVLELARFHTPSIVVMDVSMPGMDGIDATRQLRAELPEVGVVALSVHAGQRFVGDMLRAGARGYVLKESAPEELVTAIRAVARGETYLSSVVAGGVVSRFLEASAKADRSPITLSEDHRALLRFLTEGFSPQEAADRLKTTRSAVEATIGQLLDQLDMENIKELATYAEGALRPR